MPDLLGPGAAGALNAVTSRPAFTPLNQGPSDPDTWVRDCTSPIAADGTQDKAAHMNALLAQLRNLIRAGAITENSANDFMVMQAVRSQRSNWLTAGGSAAAITLSPSPSFTQRLDLIGVPLRFSALAAATGAVTITVNALSPIALTWPDGTAIAAGDWQAGAELVMVDDGTAFRLLSPLSPTQVRARTSVISRSQTFTASGTFTVPPSTRSDGLTDIEVIVIGGGGGGGASGNGSGGGLAGNSGAGGGGGGYSFRRILGLTPGATIAVTVGPGGIAGVGATSATSGGTTSFGSYFSATGGLAGVWGENTLSPGGAGGGGVGGDVNVPGGVGGSSGTNSTAAPTQSQILNIFNKGGTAPGGYGTPTFGGTGAAGRGFGDAGSGASGGSGVAGGNGASGLCIVRW